MKEALVILNSCDQGLFEGVIADITLLNIDYIASSQSKEIKEFIAIVNQTFSVVGADNAMFGLALDLPNDDLEDSIQYLCAKTSSCNIIITNDRSFYKGKIKVLDSKAFVDQFV